jgi:tetratricopeptide (TPR) repeat protein
LDCPSDSDAKTVSQSVDDLRSQAAQALGRRDPDAAEHAYRALLERDANDIYGLVGVGLVARLRGRFEDAAERFAEAAARKPRSGWPLLESGNLFRDQGRLDEAERCYRDARVLEPRNAHVLAALGDVLARRGARAEAIEVFELATTLEAPGASAFLSLASQLEQLGRADEAIAALSKGQELCQDRLALLREQARILRSLGRVDEEIGLWKIALAGAPGHYGLAMEVANTMRGLDRWEDAYSAYRSITENEQFSVDQRRDAATQGGRVWRDIRRDRTTAIFFFERAVAIDAQHPQAACELAFQYRCANRLDEAEALYRKVIARAPQHTSALAGLAVVRRLAGDAAEALRLGETVAALDPADAWNLLELGFTLRTLNRRQESADVMEKIPASSPAYAPARITLGYLAEALGRQDLCIEYFSEAAKVVADPTEPLFRIVVAKLRLGDIAGAQQTRDEIFAHDPRSVRSHLSDGLVRRATNDRSGALAAFRHAEATAPQNVQVQNEIAAEEMALGNDAAASTALDTALALDPGNEAALLSKSALLKKAGDVNAALELYAVMRRERPKSVWGYLPASELLAKAGDYEAALNLLAAARLAYGPHARIDELETEFLLQQGLLDEALSRITKANLAAPDQFPYWRARTSIEVDLGRFEAAKALLAAPPPAPTPQDRASLYKLRAHFHQAQWALEAALGDLNAAIAIDARDAGALYERAGLKLISFDLSAAWEDLRKRAEILSRGAKRKVNPMHSLLGQIYEEFIMDRSLSVEIEALRGLSPQTQVEPLMGLVRTAPDSTAPALGLMVALRRAGKLDMSRRQEREPPRAQASLIPRTITRYWNESAPPPDVARLMASWETSDPDFRRETFDDAAAISWMRERCELPVIKAFARAGEPAQRADLFRLAKLYVDGGFYIDADDRARGGLCRHVPERASFFAHQDDLGAIGNNLLGATPRHPVIRLALNGAVAGLLNGDRDVVWLTTGPGLLTRSLAQWLAGAPAEAAARLAATAIFTLAETRDIAATHCHAGYKNQHRAWLSGKSAPPKRQT